MSYDEESRNFLFNTAITALPESGEFNQEQFNEAIALLWQRIKRQDGITTCYIGRYGVEVKYMTSVIDGDRAFEIVQDAVRWAARQKQDGKYVFFPLRGDKTPEVIWKRGPKVIPAKRKVRAIFPNLTHYLPTEGSIGAFDQEGFNRLVAPLAKTLGDCLGVLSCELTQTTADLIYDTRITTYDAVCAHIREVLNASRADYFPFIAPEDELNIKLEHYNLPPS